MKTFALALAAALMASTSAFAGSAVFDVNEMPINFGSNAVQSLDLENTASIEVASAEYKPFENTKLFDVND